MIPSPKLPPIVVGTAALGSLLPDALVPAKSREKELKFLDACLELGCTAFDAAALYQLGGTERLLGAWVDSRRIRDRVFLITKGAHPNPVLGTSHFSAQDVEAELHGSLRRLRTDYVDLYLLHRDDPKRPFDEVIDALARLQKEGKVRAYGVSNWELPRLQQAHAYTVAKGLPPLAANSPHYSLFEWTKRPWPGTVSLAGADQQAARAWHAEVKLPVFAWSPLGHGYLSDPPSRHGRAHYGNAVNDGRKQRAQELAKKKGASVGDLALAFLFHQPFPVHAVVASTKPDRMKKNLDAAKLTLTPEEVRFLDGGAA